MLLKQIGALGLYLALGLAAMSVGYLWNHEPGTEWFALVSASSHAIGVICFGWLFSQGLCQTPWYRYLFAIPIALCMPLLYITHELMLLPCAYVCIAGIGFLTAGLLMMTVLYIGSDAGNQLFAKLVGATLLSQVYTIIVINVPRFFALVLLTAMPLILMYCLCPSQNTAINAEKPGSHPLPALPLMLMACAFLYSFGMAFYQGDPTSDGSSPKRVEVISCGLVILVALISAGVWIARKRRATFLSLVFAPLLSAGLLLLPFVTYQGSLASGSLIFAGKSFFSLYLYAILFLESTHPRDLIFRFASIIAVNDIGLCVGSIAADRLIGASTELVWGICIVVAFLALNLSFMLSYSENGRYGALFGSLFILDDSPEPQANTLQEDSPLNKKSLAAAAERFGFSAREKDVLAVLVTGETFNAMAQDLGISYNTVKTHVAHIYQKAGVSTRKELIEEIVKQASEE